MKSIVLMCLMFSMSAFAGTKMGKQAIEMATVIAHPQVKECLSDVRLDDMINVSIEKDVARCLGCNTYTITGNKLIGGDVPDTRPTVIKLVGKAERAVFGFGYTQTFKCELTNP